MTHVAQIELGCRLVDGGCGGAERFLSCRILSRGLSGVKPWSAGSHSVTSQNVRAACERQWASMGAGANGRLPTFLVSSAVDGAMSSAVLRLARKWRCGSSANSLE